MNSCPDQEAKEAPSLTTVIEAHCVVNESIGYTANCTFSESFVIDAPTLSAADIPDSFIQGMKDLDSGKWTTLDKATSEPPPNE